MGNRSFCRVRRVVRSFVRQPLSSIVFASLIGPKRSARVQNAPRFHARRACAPCCVESGLSSRIPQSKEDAARQDHETRPQASFGTGPVQEAFF